MWGKKKPRAEQKDIQTLLQAYIRTIDSSTVALQEMANIFAQSQTQDPDVSAVPALADTAILANRALTDHLKHLFSRMK